MNKNYKNVQNVLIYDKKRKRSLFVRFFRENARLSFGKLYGFCTFKKRKLYGLYGFLLKCTVVCKNARFYERFFFQ